MLETLLCKIPTILSFRKTIRGNFCLSIRFENVIATIIHYIKSRFNMKCFWQQTQQKKMRKIDEKLKPLHMINVKFYS